MRLLPKDLAKILPPPFFRKREDGAYEMSFHIDTDFDPSGRDLPALKATQDSPSLYPHAPKRDQR